MIYLKMFLVSLPVFLALDMIWLGLIAKNFYQKHLGFLMGPVNWPAALVFYFLFVFGLVVLVIYPATAERDFLRLLFTAALFWLVTYGT